MRMGPIQFTFMYWPPRGSPTHHISSARIRAVHGSASRPPQADGQCGTRRPAFASFAQNSFENLVCASEAGPCASCSQLAGRLAERNSRTIDRKATCLSSHAKSISFLSAYPCMLPSDEARKKTTKTALTNTQDVFKFS